MSEGSVAAGDGFDLLFREISEPSFLVDITTGHIVASNPAASTLLGYSADELAAISPTDLHPHELPRLEAFFAQVLREGRWASDDLACRTRSGHLIPAEIRAFLLEIEGRRHVLTLVRDLRDRRMADVGQSVRRVVHDLRNALATAQILSDRLAEHEDTAVRASSAVITRSLERAVELCRQTIEAGTAVEKRPQCSHFFLGDVVAEVAATATAPVAGEARIEYDFDADVVVFADFEQLYRILLNLVRNAAKVGARIIDISGHEDGARLAIMVRDDGPGLPEHVQRALTERQSQTLCAKSGLGLIIASELAENHGGRLLLHATGPGGTAFVIELPIRSDG